MDAKSRAGFINSVTAGLTVRCPSCGTENEPNNKFCLFCGAEMAAKTTAKNDAPAFEPAAEEPQQLAEEPVECAEPMPIFADGLPGWDIVPPQVMVRRR